MLYYSFGLEASGQIGKGKENSDSLQQRNSTIQANQLEITSQHDTNLKGAVVKAERLDANIGHDLTIESRQDSQTYHSKQTQAGAGVSIALGSGGSASANLILNKAKMNYAQVEEQSGLQIGKDGMNVNVANNTHLKGGLIDSQATTDKNHFSTNTLTSENIKNHSEVSVQSISAGFSTAGVAQNVMSAMGTVASALGNKNDTASSTTYSAVGSNVHLDIKNPDNSTPVNLSRNTKNANEKVQRFDVAEIKEQQEAVQVAGELAARIVGDVSKQLQLKDGSKEKIALHAFAGFLAAKAGDGNALAGAAAGAASEWLNTQVADYLSQHKNLTEDERKAIQQASALGIGAIAGALTGGGTEAIKQGALTSFNAEKFNRQLHPDEMEWIKHHAKEFAEEQNISEEEATHLLMQQAAREVDFLWFLSLKDEGAEERNARTFLERQKSQTFTDAKGNVQHYFVAKDNDYFRARVYGKEADAYNSANNQFVNHYLTDSVARTAWQGLKDKTGQRIDYVLDNKIETIKNVATGIATSAKECVGSLVDCVKDWSKEATYGVYTNGIDVGNNLVKTDQDKLNRLYGRDVELELAVVSSAGLVANASEMLWVGKIVTTTGKAVGNQLIKQGERVISNMVDLTYRMPVKPPVNPYIDIKDSVSELASNKIESERLLNIGKNREGFNSDLNNNINEKPKNIRNEQVRSRVADIAYQFNTKSIEPKDMKLTINGQTYNANPETSTGVPVFKGVSDQNVISYFKELAGIDKLPLPKEVSGKGRVWSVKPKEGPLNGSVINLRDYSSSTANTNAKFTIDIVRKRNVDRNISGIKRDSIEIKFEK